MHKIFHKCLAFLKSTLVTLIVVKSYQKYVVEVRNLRVKYLTGEKVYVPKFSIKAGSLISIVGPNGGGKSTFVKAILGLLPYEGEVKLFGRPLEKLDREERKMIGYLPQFSYQKLHFPITVGEVISMPGLKRDLTKELGIYDLRDKLMSELSGGQRQRVLLARAFANDPQLVILDEPESNLDVKWRDKVIKLLKKLSKEGKTIIYVTHDLTMTLKVADGIACINKDVFFHGSLRDVLGRLQEVYGCEFAPFLHAKGIEHVVVKKHD